MPDTITDLPPETPSLAARVVLLSIEQSRANWQGQLDKAKEIGEAMLAEVAKGIR